MSTTTFMQLPDDHYADDRRIDCADGTLLTAELILGAASRRLESDGRISRLQARKELAGFTCIENPNVIVDQLIDLGLALAIDTKTIELTDWSRWMASHGELETYREDRRRRGRNGGKKSAEVRRAKRAASDNPTTPLENGEAACLSVAQQDKTRQDNDTNGIELTRHDPPNGEVVESSSVFLGLKDAAKDIAQRRFDAGKVDTTIEDYANGIVETWQTERSGEVQTAIDEGWTREKVRGHFNKPKSSSSAPVASKPVGVSCNQELCESSCRYSFDPCHYYDGPDVTRRYQCCPTCNGDLLIENDDGDMVACKDCKRTGLSVAL